MKQIIALSLRLAILGACMPLFANSFVNSSGKRRTNILPRTDSLSIGRSASKQLVQRFLSEQNNDDDETKPPTPPSPPPVPDVPSKQEETEMKANEAPPSEETVEAERPRVPLSVPVPVPPPKQKPKQPPKQVQQQIEKPKKPSRSLTPDEQKLAVASGVGGLVAGALLGVLVDVENPNIDLIMSPILPPVIGAVFVSTFGFALGGSDGGFGSVIRTTLGGPTVAVGNLISSIIEAIISNAVTSAKNKVKNQK